ncbi:hypothetical protein [Mesoflavibacter zeaxanthinifaciens]|uniref:hypothetical protein n=1 Tax=Mesoflavibacter zeaxanthinifaciens TaxID=393060 RepID=UPI003A90EC8A
MKNLKNLGKALSKAEQKTINGGAPDNGCRQIICPPGCHCKSGTFKCWNNNRTGECGLIAL